MNILDIAIAKKLAGGGGGSGTDNYNDLSNLPKINDTTLSGNKSSSALGLQSEINSDSKLASDLVDDTNQDNKFVTSTEKNTWNAKQNAIDADHKINADYVDDSTSANKFVTSTEKNTWNAKQNAIDSDHKLSSSLVGFTTAEAAALASGIDSSKVDQISTNQTNILYVLNKSGSKNVLVPKYDKYTNNEVSYTVNADGTITVVIASTTAANRELPITDAISNVYDGMIISGSPSGNNIELLITGLNSDGTYENEQFSYNQAHSTINRGTPKIKFSIYVKSGTAAQTVTVYPMVQDASITDFTFAKPALPNYDLTRMMTPFFTMPINHNMIYRGRNLGATLTDAQHTALSSGNFTDLYLGDYWTKTVTIPAGTYTGGDGEEVTVPAQTNITLKAVIADFDTFYAGYASTYAGINTHHAAVIVTGFSNVVWNSTNTTAGGYVNSLIHKWLVGSVLPQIETWFGSAKVLSHQKLLTNAITGDAASGWAWSSQKISLLSENQMYGSKVWGNSKAANGGYEPGEAFKHLNVFNHIDANLLFGNKNIWLRDIASAGWAAFLNYRGFASCTDASSTGFAPVALILLS